MCSKVPFATEAAAKDALVRAKIRFFLHGNQKRRESRAYQCPSCHGAWHLTSQENAA